MGIEFHQTPSGADHEHLHPHEYLHQGEQTQTIPQEERDCDDDYGSNQHIQTEKAKAVFAEGFTHVFVKKDLRVHRPLRPVLVTFTLAVVGARACTVRRLPLLPVSSSKLVPVAHQHIFIVIGTAEQDIEEQDCPRSGQKSPSQAQPCRHTALDQSDGPGRCPAYERGGG